MSSPSKTTVSNVHILGEGACNIYNQRFVDWNLNQVGKLTVNLHYADWKIKICVKEKGKNMGVLTPPLGQSEPQHASFCQIRSPSPTHKDI